MKTLMTFELSSGKIYANSKPQFGAFSAEGCQQDNPVDWREDFKKYVSEHGWEVNASDLDSVASMVDFMISHSSSFEDCVRRDDVSLPGGTVVLDSKSGGTQSPIMLLWEADI